MKITKFGHSCMLVEDGNLRVIIDPGAYSTLQNDVREVDAVLITHEHMDHLDPNSLRTVMANNPQARIFTNQGVGQILENEGIKYEALENGQNILLKNVLIETYGKKHAVIYPTLPVVDDTGYLIGERFFYPGDAFHKPSKSVEILALPVVAPWARIAECIDYAKELKPEICFPVHDGMLKIIGPVHNLPSEILSPLGIKFMVLEEGKEYEF